MNRPCIFCDIVDGRAPAEIVHRTEHLVVFPDIRPQAPVHLLIVPAKHIRSVNDLAPEDRPILADMLLAGKQMAQRFGISASGYKLVVNVERGGGQVIFHLHLHLIGGWQR
ncbi:MAG: histidine triad nucleotide-binding protein [Desulfobacterales bacterium]|jgi:histidine triad (HIT) family protein|nr:histidine triad nucleotide-binding protein [Desulfobacterales bacterium]